MLPIMGLLGGLLGGGGGGGGGGGFGVSDSSQTSSESGDASSALSMPFSYGGNMQVGGSGNRQDATTSQTSDASARAGDTPASGVTAQGDNTIVYVALGVAGLAVIASAFRR